MKLERRQFLHLSGAALAGIATRPTAWAQGYPERAVRVIVPYAPGGPTDIIARLVALKLSDRVGKQFYVENIAAPAAISAWAGRPRRRPMDIRFCSSLRPM